MVLAGWGQDLHMLFFSNRLGCLGSIAVSLTGTAVVIILLILLNHG